MIARHSSRIIVPALSIATLGGMLVFSAPTWAEDGGFHTELLQEALKSDAAQHSAPTAQPAPSGSSAGADQSVQDAEQNGQGFWNKFWRDQSMHGG
ncbi:MAG: hypothetical protein M3Z21_03620 [Pseudomonadota bacterium]|nr:hypothetical protein [Pseudomonadota bacterium]